MTSPFSAESPRSSESTPSLSEAFLDSSSFRTRDSLPEQYRVHFDELRQSIFIFCDEFHIPVSALGNKEAFKAELTSKKISAERMAEAVSLFERLEHLVTRGEPLKEIHSEYLEEAERLYHLREQYHTQVSLLERVGILENGSITGIDGNQYPIPTLDQIVERLFSPERRKLLEIKRDQGFAKLLLVPFGMSLNALQEVLKQFLLSYKTNHPDFILNTDIPFTIWEGYQGADTGDHPKLFYNPKPFDKEGDRQGQTKLQILGEQRVLGQARGDNGCAGWTIHLFQSLNTKNLDLDSPKGIAPIPRKGRGKTRGERFFRPDIEAGKTPLEYLFILEDTQDDTSFPYYGESGLTPEDWIIAFMTHLQETGELLDNHGNSTESATDLLRTFFSNSVPCAYWDCNDHMAYLRGSDVSDRYVFVGARTSVVI